MQNGIWICIWDKANVLPRIEAINLASKCAVPRQPAAVVASALGLLKWALFGRWYNGFGSSAISHQVVSDKNACSTCALNRAGYEKSFVLWARTSNKLSAHNCSFSDAESAWPRKVCVSAPRRAAFASKNSHSIFVQYARIQLVPVCDSSRAVMPQMYAQHTKYECD